MLQAIVSTRQTGKNISATLILYLLSVLSSENRTLNRVDLHQENLPCILFGTFTLNRKHQVVHI